MDLDRHDFQLDELVEKIKSNDHRLVALQVPEGLKMQALEMMDQIEDDSGAKVILAADPCYGACDLVHDKMRAMGVELVAHMGHSQMNIDSGMPTQFISVTYDGEPEIESILPILKSHLSIAESRIGADFSTELNEKKLKMFFWMPWAGFLPLSRRSWDLSGPFNIFTYCRNIRRCSREQVLR